MSVAKETTLHPCVDPALLHTDDGACPRINHTVAQNNSLLADCTIPQEEKELPSHVYIAHKLVDRLQLPQYTLVNSVYFLDPGEDHTLCEYRRDDGLCFQFEIFCTETYGFVWRGDSRAECARRTAKYPHGGRSGDQVVQMLYDSIPKLEQLELSGHRPESSE